MVNIHAIRDAKHVHTFAKGEGVLGMREFRGCLFVATTRGIYRMEGGKLRPVEVGVDMAQAVVDIPIKLVISAGGREHG